MGMKLDLEIKRFSYYVVQAALVIRGGYVPTKCREYQNRGYQVQ